MKSDVATDAEQSFDPLNTLLARAGLSANVFYSGKLCETVSFGQIDDAHAAPGDEDQTKLGHLHLLRSGSLQVINAQGKSLLLTEPSVLFYAQPLQHRFMPDVNSGADLLCASLNLGDALNATIVPAMPVPLVIPLKEIKTLSGILELLFAEAFAQHSGRQMALDRLAEYLLLLLLRHVIESKKIQSGTLAAFADPKLSRVVQMIHERPEHPWTIDTLADVAGMSRARLAAHFREKTGETVLGYLTRWRIALAQHLLLKGKSVKAVAQSVGYQTTNALNKPFVKVTGQTVSKWVKARVTVTISSK